VLRLLLSLLALLRELLAEAGEVVLLLVEVGTLT
jgi:hypothetical protein